MFSPLPLAGGAQGIANCPNGQFALISAARYALAIILGQIFINGAALEWWGGDAYGARRFTDIAAVLILGLALLLWRVQHRWLRYSLLALCSLIVLGNLALMQVYRLDLIPRDQTLLR